MTVSRFKCHQDVKKIFWGKKFCSTVYDYTAHLLQCPSKNKVMPLLTTVLQTFLRPCIQCEEIWKRCFHPENASNLGRPHYTSEKFENGGFTLKLHQTFSDHTICQRDEQLNIQRSIWICVWGKLGQGNHVIFERGMFSAFSTTIQLLLTGNN